MSLEIPPSSVNQALAEQFLVAGVEPSLLKLNAGFFLFVLILFKGMWWVIGGWACIAFLIHLMLKSLSRDDPFLRRIYLRYQTQADRYEPFPYLDAASRRPIDFGKDTLQ